MPVSIGAMRERLLARLDQERPVDDWVEILARQSSREVLSIIGRNAPQSIGALSEIAGRAQPNVSRTLTSLVSANLVETKNDGRRTIPSLTQFGLQKANELGLLDRAPEPEAHIDEDRLVAVGIQKVAPVGANVGDIVSGTLEIAVWERTADQASSAIMRTDLAKLAERVLTDWWRLFYRRDSVWRLGEVILGSTRSDRPAVISLQSNGRDIQFLVRNQTGETVPLARNGSEPIARVETALLEAFLHPVVNSLRAAGRVDRVVQSLLSRLEDSRSDAGEAAFCRAAGALDIAPYDLTDAVAADVRNVIEQFPDEDARLDFASSLAVDELREQSDWLRREIDAHSATNSLGTLEKLRGKCAHTGGGTPMQPWRVGRDCARVARTALQLGSDASLQGVEGVAHLLGADSFQLSGIAPGALRGFQTLDDGKPIIFVEDEGPNATAFTLARAIGDYLVHGSPTSCVADIYTERQKVGRAFAAEFLAPGEGIVRMVEEEGQSSGRIARHYGVSPEVVSRQYQNYARAV